MSKFESLTSPEFLVAVEKFKAHGPLGVTADDHLTIGSTPPKKLEENPDRTLGELMTEEEIVDWIKELEKQIAEFSQEKYKNNSFVKSSLPKLIEDLNLGKKYLTSIGKLPAEKE